MTEVRIYNDLGQKPKIVRTKREIINRATGDHYAVGALLRMPFAMARELWKVGACDFVTVGDLCNEMKNNEIFNKWQTY